VVNPEVVVVVVVVGTMTEEEIDWRGQ